MLNDDWQVGKDHCFTSALNKRQPDQLIIFSDQIKNGSIRADITPLAGTLDNLGRYGKEASIVFRYGGAENYYYAGLGAFRSKFFIAKAMPGPMWQLLGHVGNRDSIAYKKTYRMRVDCVGSQITLYENDVKQLAVVDETYQVGQWGFLSLRTKASFKNVKTQLSTPVCFVIMPFASELDFVYRVIKETVEKFKLKCVRADEIYVSRPVVEDIKGQIAGADLVIVDFTNKNPNVYYEAGLADAWKKKWIVLAQSQDDLTFDVRHIRTILYSDRMGADEKLRDELEQAIHETTGFNMQRG
jgi:hypothetical protein